MRRVLETQATLDHKSFEEKLGLVTDLSFELCYDVAAGPGAVRDLGELFGKSLEDLLWGYCDGLTQQWHIKVQGGRCSLRAMVDYDLAAEEAKLDKHILKFQELLGRLSAREEQKEPAHA